MRRRTAALALAACVATSAAACANSGGDLSATAAHNLRQYVEAVRQAAASGSYAQLQEAVAALQAEVQKEEDSGDVSSQRANEILNAAGILLTDAKPSASPTPSPTVPPTTTTVAPTTTTVPPTTTTVPSPTPDALPTGPPTPLVHVSAHSQSK